PPPRSFCQDPFAGQKSEGEERENLADGEQPPDGQRSAVGIGRRRHQAERWTRAEPPGDQERSRESQQGLEEGAQHLGPRGPERQRQQRDRAERRGLAVAEEGLAASCKVTSLRRPTLGW